MDKEADTSRLQKSDIVQILAEKHGKFIDKLREVKVGNLFKRHSAFVVEKEQNDFFFMLFRKCISCSLRNFIVELKMIIFSICYVQTASLLGPMAQLCHRYSNLAHTVWVDLFPQLWNLLTDKQQQVSLELPFSFIKLLP